MRKAAILSCGPYDIANVRIDTIGVYTNNTPSGAFRTFGGMQAQFATESMLDLAAERIGLDPFEIRRRNMMKKGGLTHTKQELGSVSLGRVLEAAENSSHWEAGAPEVRGAIRQDLGKAGTRKPCTLGARIRQTSDKTDHRVPGKVRGRGVAASWYGIARTATIDRAGAWAELDDGGTAKIVTGVTEIGEGILTLLAQVAAEELGVRPQDITIGDNDTARSPEAAHAGATRQTYMIGNCVALACREARAKLDEQIADHWSVPVDKIEAFNGEIWAQGTNFKMTMEEAIDLTKKRGVVPVGSGSFHGPRHGP